MSPKYRDLNATPGKKMAEIVRALREQTQSSKTGAAGVTDYGEHGDATWTDPSTGTETSVREIPETIIIAREEIAAAEEKIEQTKEQLAAEALARELLAEASTLKFVELDGHLADANEKLDLAFPDGAFDVADELSRTVRSTVVQYALHSSETTAPMSGWSTTAPARTPGAFIWIRTVLTYGDDSTATSGAALLTGNAGAPGATGAPGDDGTPGKDGVGLTSTTISYAQTTSGTTAPTTGWTAAVPTLIKGRYLWTRTVWAYTDSTSETGYSVAYVAQDGADGDDGLPGAPGVGIRSTAITYAASASGTTAPTSGWTAQPPNAAAGQFVWTRTVWTYTDNATETGYSVGKIGNTGATGSTGSTGAPGSPGADGAQGVGVTSVTPYFRDVAAGAAKPAKPTTMTPSGWSTTEPAWAPARDLYRVERVVYTTNAFAYTDVSKIAAYAGIDAAMAAANGKNLNTYTDLAVASKPGPAPAPNSARTVGDVHRNRDTTTGEIWAEYQWTGTAWKDVTFGDAILRSLDVGKITGGTGSFQEFFSQHFIANTGVINQLWLDALVGRAATLQQLVVSPGNLVPDPGGLEGSVRNALGGTSWTWDAAGRYWKNLSPVSGGTTQFNAFVPIAGTSNYDLNNITPGEEYRLSWEVWVDAPATSPAGARGAIYFRRQDGTTSFVGDGGGATPVPASTWTKIERSWTAPVNASSGAIGFQFLYTPAGATEIRLRNPIVSPKVGAVLIENGSIGADKVIADEVAAAVSTLVKARVENLVVTDGATINEAVILKLASEMITAGVLRTAEAGQRLEIDSNGLIMWGVDGDGTEYEMVRLGSSGENLLTIGDSAISESSMVSPTGAFGQVSVGGEDLTGLLATSPRGLIARARSTSFGEWDGSGNENWRLQLNFYTFPGRSYRVTVSSHYVQTRSALPNTVTEYLRWTDLTDGVGVTSSSPQLAGLVHNIPRAGSYSVPGLVSLLDGSMVGSSEDGTRTQVVLSARSPAGQDIRFLAGEGYPLALFVEDIGPTLPWTGRSWVHVGTPSQGSTGGDAPEPDKQQRYTTTWTPQGSGGDLSGGDIVQGQYGSYGNRSGSWTMPAAMRTALQSANIEKVEIYLKNSHWYYGSGGTASIRATDGSAFKAFVGTAFTVPGWKRGEGRWVTVPTLWHSQIRAGNWKGIGVQTSSTSLLYYGRWDASSTRFRATYTR